MGLCTIVLGAGMICLISLFLIPAVYAFEHASYLGIILYLLLLTSCYFLGRQLNDSQV